MKSNAVQHGLLNFFSDALRQGGLIPFTGFSTARSPGSACREPIRSELVPCNVTMDSGTVLRLTKESGVKELEVRQGAVWLTGTPASGDVLLQSGDRFVCTGNWPYVLQALGDTAMVLRL
jgi:DUF2917 family protein